MSLRTFLRLWLRGLEAVRRDLHELAEIRRMARNDDALYAADTAELERARGAMTYRYRSIEALLSMPATAPDRSRHQFPPVRTLEDGAEWLALAYPRTWGRYTTGLRQLHVGIWLGRRADVRREERVS